MFLLFGTSQASVDSSSLPRHKPSTLLDSRALLSALDDEDKHLASLGRRNDERTVVKGKNASEVSLLQIAWLTMDEKRLEMSEGEETAAVGTRSGGGSLKSRFGNLCTLLYRDLSISFMVRH